MKNITSTTQFSDAATIGTKSLLSAFALFLIGLTSLGILSVSIMAFMNPQSVMDLVHVNLPNTDAYSSIRGVYGGAGMTIFMTLAYLAFTNRKQGLIFTSLLCGLYAFSRLITFYSEGPLGEFGKTWLIIESSMCILSLFILGIAKKTKL